MSSHSRSHTEASIDPNATARDRSATEHSSVASLGETHRETARKQSGWQKPIQLKAKKKYENPFSEFAQEASSAHSFGSADPTKDQNLKYSLDALRNRAYSGPSNSTTDEDAWDLKIHAALRGHPVLDPLCKNPRGRELLTYQKYLDRQSEIDNKNAKKPQTQSDRMQGVVLPGMGDQAKHARELILQMYPKKKAAHRNALGASASTDELKSPTTSKRSSHHTRQAVARRSLAQFIAQRWRVNGIDKLFHEIDDDHSGHVGLKEWIEGLQKQGFADDAVLIFHWLDIHHKGLISLADIKHKLKSVVDAFGPTLHESSPSHKQIAHLEKELEKLDDGFVDAVEPAFVGLGGLKTGLFARKSVGTSLESPTRATSQAQPDDMVPNQPPKRTLFSDEAAAQRQRALDHAAADSNRPQANSRASHIVSVNPKQLGKSEDMPCLNLEAATHGQRLSRNGTYYSIKHALGVRCKKQPPSPSRNDKKAKEEKENESDEAEASVAPPEHALRKRGGTLIFSVSETRKLRAQLQDYVCGSTASHLFGEIKDKGDKNPAANLRKEFLRIHVYGYGTPYGEVEELYIRKSDPLTWLLRRCAVNAARPICGAPTAVFDMNLNRIASPDDLEDGGEYILSTGDIPNCLSKVPEPIRAKLEDAVNEENKIQSDLLRIAAAIHYDYDRKSYLAYLHGNSGALHLQKLDWYNALAELHLELESDWTRLFEAVSEQVMGLNMRYVTGSSLEQALYAARAKSMVSSNAGSSSALKRGASARSLAGSSGSSAVAKSASEPQLRSVFEGATDLFQGASGLLADVQNTLDSNRNRFSELFTAATADKKARKTDKASQKRKKKPGDSDRSSGQAWHIPNLKQELKDLKQPLPPVEETHTKDDNVEIIG